jgi:hypothetical protein
MYNCIYKLILTCKFRFFIWTWTLVALRKSRVSNTNQEYWFKSLSGRRRSSALVKRNWHRSLPRRRECPTAGLGAWAVTRSCHDSEVSLAAAAEAGRRRRQDQQSRRRRWPEQETEAASWERELEVRLGKNNGKGRRGWAPHGIAIVSYFVSWYSTQIWYRTPLSLPLWCATSIFLLNWTAWYWLWYQRCDQSQRLCGREVFGLVELYATTWILSTDKVMVLLRG